MCLYIIIELYLCCSGSLQVHSLGKLVEFSDTPNHLLPDKYRSVSFFLSVSVCESYYLVKC